jgi:hypothetical protein
MAQFTTDLAKRDPRKFALTKTEAAAMLQAGFRFSEFNTDSDNYTLSIPHTVIRELDRGIISFEQG